MDRKDRQRGTLLGLAVGDALGAAVEFEMPGTSEPVSGYRGGGPHGLAPGEWTDDTSLALALADSIASVGWDINDQAHRYLDWWLRGKYSVNGECFDIGSTTQYGLRRFQHRGDARASGDPSETPGRETEAAIDASGEDAGRTGERRAGTDEGPRERDTGTRGPGEHAGTGRCTCCAT